jgi:drug/metabolite transporter (DMT)-like permease
MRSNRTHSSFNRSFALEILMKTKDWLAFIALSLAWGSSFFWIKIAVQEVGPFLLVAFRVLFGILGLLVVLGFKRPKQALDRRAWQTLLILGITNTAAPFVLISWAEQHIDSAVAAILNSSMPLFTLVIAHFTVADDKMNFQKTFGVLVGFLGVVVLTARDLGGDLRMNFLAQLAMLGAVLCYAGSTVFARRNTQDISPVVRALIPLLSADAVIWAGALWLEAPVRLPALGLTWGALLWLGIIGSCVAYLLYYYLLHSVGPTRISMVTYMFPVVGVALGVLILNERLDFPLIAGAALILGSLVIVSRSPAVASVGAEQRAAAK